MKNIILFSFVLLFSQASLAASVLHLKSGKIDLENKTITLPLYRGLYTPYKGAPSKLNRRVWYVVTDTTNQGQAESLGINWSAKLGFANTLNTRSVRKADLVNTMVEGVGVVPIFYGGQVDFTPEHSVTPGEAPNFFPPQDFQAGAVADMAYSPLAEINGDVYNMPIMAFDKTPQEIDFCNKPVDHSVMHDAVVSVCPAQQEITLKLIEGYSSNKRVLYLSTDASDPMVAALEKATFAPVTDDFILDGQNELFSAVENIFVIANGETNGYGMNPERQGLNSALHGDGDPLNILGGIPGLANDYSPLWDLYVTRWTDNAIAAERRSLLRSENQVLLLEESGFMTAADGGPIQSSGLLVNCPIVYQF